MHVFHHHHHHHDHHHHHENGREFTATTPSELKVPAQFASTLTLTLSTFSSSSSWKRPPGHHGYGKSVLIFKFKCGTHWKIGQGSLEWSSLSPHTLQFSTKLILYHQYPPENFYIHNQRAGVRIQLINGLDGTKHFKNFDFCWWKDFLVKYIKTENRASELCAIRLDRWILYDMFVHLGYLLNRTLDIWLVGWMVW